MPKGQWRVNTGDGEGLLVQAHDEDKDGAPTIRRFRRTDEGERRGIPVSLPEEGADLHHLAAILRTAADVRATTDRLRDKTGPPHENRQ